VTDLHSQARELALLIGIAEAAARLIADIYHAPGALEVEWKAPGDPVTRADREANALIVDRLAHAFPGVPIVAEESAPQSYAGFESHPRVLFVDPLDGTKEFVARSGEFAVMIGLVEAGVPTLGVVTRPHPFATYAGGVGVGVVRRVPGFPDDLLTLDEEPAVMSDATVVVSRSQRAPEASAALLRLGARTLKPYGSAGLIPMGLSGAGSACAWHGRSRKRRVRRAFGVPKREP
jgi:3'(2'), 5'-bisphosphate nucleotidase